MKLFLSTIVIMIASITSQIISLAYKLASNEKECFSEYFPDKTAVILSVEAGINDLEVQLMYPNQTYVHIGKGQKYQYAFTTDISGYYETCTINYSNDLSSDITFKLKYGVGAKDYSSLARTKDLQPIDLELRKMIDLHPTLNHYVGLSKRYDWQFDHILERITSKIIFYSVILIIVMTLVGGLETYFLRRFLIKRKII